MIKLKKLSYIFLISIILINCGGNKYSYNTDHLKKTMIEINIISIYENENAYVLISDNNDIIEVFKEPYNFNKSCRKIHFNKKQKFKVLDLNGIIQGGSTERTYMLNDSVAFYYNQYYFISTFKKYRFDKKTFQFSKRNLNKMDVGNYQKNTPITKIGNTNKFP